MTNTSRKAVLACAITAGLVAATLSAATAASSPALSGATGNPTATTTTLVTLVTGDQLAVSRTDGRTGYAVPRPAPGSGFQTFRDPSGDEYFIPAVAAPYLGHGLDKSLFDITALLRNGITNAANIPVTLSFATGTTPNAPAGITLTATRDGTATGYLTPASAAAFGAALRRRIGADVAAGRPAGSSAPVTALTGISLAGATEPSPVTPHYPVHPLQLNVTDLTGAPAASANVILMNADAAARETTVVPVVHGSARIEIPSGDYTAVADFLDLDSSGSLVATRQVLLTDVSVPDAATSVAIDERAAGSLVSASTPRPASTDLVAITADRFDAAGTLVSIGSVTFGAPTYVNAQPAPTVGRLHYVTQWGGEQPAGASSGAEPPYRYDAAFASDNGIPADQNYVVGPDQLATVHHTLYADPVSTGPGDVFVGATDPTILTGALFFAYGVPATLPGPLTEYLGTADTGGWSVGVLSPNQVQMNAPLRTFQPGGDYQADWLHGPLVPNQGQYTGGNTCDACTAGTDLSIGFTLLGDSDPTHVGLPLKQPDTLHFTLYQGDTPVFDEDDTDSAAVTGIPLTPTTYRAVIDLGEATGGGFSQSTRSHTELTVHYDPASDPGLALPSEDSCVGQSADTPCQILPAVTLNYQLATDLTNTGTAPVQTLALTVGHLSYDGHGSRSPITTATVSVSFDGGQTWQPATVDGTAGHYQASWPNPSGAQGSTPAIKVTATDADGNAISQVVDNAYTIGGSQ